MQQLVKPSERPPEGYISQIHLVLLDFALNKPLVEQWIEQGTVSCPTLVMILAVAEILACTGGGHYSASNASVTAFARS